MLRLYSDQAAEGIIRRFDASIREIASRYSLPTAVLQAVLYQEITQIDLLDLAADLAVRLNGLRLALCERLSGREAVIPRKRGVLYKFDSSTGYAQIYACVGIIAINFALDRAICTPEELGLTPDQRLDAESFRDLRLVWQRLNRDPAYNLQLAALNLLCAAEEKTGRIDFGSYTPEELQLILTRYNGTSPTVSAYGRAAYAHYLRFMDKQ